MHITEHRRNENGFADAAEFQKTKNPRYEMAPSSVEEAQQYYKEILNSAGEIAGMHVSQAAQAIVAGLASGDFEIHFPRRFTLWLKLLRCLPYRLYFPLIRRLTGA